MIWTLICNSDTDTRVIWTYFANGVGPLFELCTAFFFAVSQQLVIKSVNVPATVKAGEVDHVILDCDYELENTSGEGLVVKWFLESDKTVYQWIQGLNPIADEPAKKYADLTYRASDDPYTEYRAMKLNKPGIELTGDYTCVISTFEDEKTANAFMVVYGERRLG